MPELPEVQTICQGMMPHVLYQRIASVVIRQTRLRWPVPDDLGETLQGKTVTSIYRRGKYILLDTGQGTLLIHLGMSGRITILPRHKDSEAHDHLDIIFEAGQLLRFTDPRRFGCLLWVEGDPLEHPLLNKLGPEPLTEAFDGEYLYEKGCRRYTPIKSFIMNSEIVAGIGNIYANEALFHARIDPQASCGTLSLGQYQQLVSAIKKVLVEAIECGGTTLKDFFSSDGTPGYFSQKLHVYGRANQPCLICKSLLKQFQLNQRATVYCPQCQES